MEESTTTDFTNTSSSTLNLGSTTTATYYTPYSTSNKSFSAYNWESMVEATLKILESPAVLDPATRIQAAQLLNKLISAASENMINNQAVLA